MQINVECFLVYRNTMLMTWMGKNRKGPEQSDDSILRDLREDEGVQGRYTEWNWFSEQGRCFLRKSFIAHCWFSTDDLCCV